MIEPKISLSLLVPGASMISQQEAENKPKESYNELKIPIRYFKGKGKFKKEIRDTVSVKTRKQKLIIQNLSICKEAYEYMLHQPTTSKLAKPIEFNKRGEVVKRAWDNLTIHERLKHHFDIIAYDLGAVSYSYEILED